jgi:polysaccharide export outer membrane protein
MEPASSYIVGAPDSLVVEVLPEPMMQYQVTVRPDGKITIPLIGEVAAGGHSITDIAADIEHRIRKFKKGALVTVSLGAAVSTDITVLGEVGAQSSFALVKATRIIEVIGQVGGVSNMASAGSVRVIRVEHGMSVIYEVDVKAIRRGDQSTNIMLKPGDIIYVPPTVLAKIGYVIQQILFPFQPVLGVAQSMGGNLIIP